MREHHVNPAEDIMDIQTGTEAYSGEAGQGLAEYSLSLLILSVVVAVGALYALSTAIFDLPGWNLL